MTAATTVLRNGDRGPEVVDLQHLLMYRGGVASEGEGVAVDGVFGPKTESVVKGFQMLRQLTVDGVVGSVTWSELADPQEWPTQFTGVFLRKGDTGAQALQRGLQAKGFYNGQIDGDFGPLTHAAVVKFQQAGVGSFNSPITNTEGVVGPLTFSNAMRNVMR